MAIIMVRCTILPPNWWWGLRVGMLARRGARSTSDGHQKTVKAEVRNRCQCPAPTNAPVTNYQQPQQVASRASLLLRGGVASG
jgi:hypothetical protein